MEKTNWFYACFASALRSGGLWMAVLARLSFIPPNCESSFPC